MQFPKELRLCVVSVPKVFRDLNEVQFPKELRPRYRTFISVNIFVTSMKCSSRRNCDRCLGIGLAWLQNLNEVQFPKELRPRGSARRAAWRGNLNEVQFPKELRRWGLD